MTKQNVVTGERAIELELWLSENYPISITSEKLFNLLSSKFSSSEIEFLISAYYIPISDIRKQLIAYDNTSPRLDELKFISFLQRRYNCDTNMIIKRIRYVRRINKYLKKNPDIVLPDAQLFDKLVRDNISEIIQSQEGNECLDDEEYWKYLLNKDREELEKLQRAKSKEELKEGLCNKLEVIKVIANYCGLTLDDISTGDDLKKKEQVSFSKKF